MKRLWNVLLCFFLLFSSGCYEEKVKVATSKLKIGMTKIELDHLFKDLKFLKEQTVSVYPKLTESQTRAILWNDRHYDYLNPQDLITDQMVFNGDVKVYSYLVHKESSWPNGWNTHYVVIFYNYKKDKIIGWAKMSTMIEPRLWNDQF